MNKKQTLWELKILKFYCVEHNIFIELKRTNENETIFQGKCKVDNKDIQLIQYINGNMDIKQKKYNF